MMNLILQLMVFTLFVRRDVLSLKCYSCDSSKNPSCGRQFDSTKVDSCSGNFCWINETWKGAANYPPPADVSLTTIRACVDSSSIFTLMNTDDGVYYTQTCSDKEYCNGPVAPPYLPPPPSPNNSKPMSCYFCSGDGCSVPLANMAKCNGPSCYKEVSNSKVINRTCLPTETAKQSSYYTKNGAVFSTMICSENLCNRACSAFGVATSAIVVVAVAAMFFVLQ